MQDVLAVLEPEEPDYRAAAELGPESLPHLAELVRGDDPMLASKAAYAASMLEGNQGQEVVVAAARHGDSVVRVAAAAAARNLPPADASDLLVSLVSDDDPGVRKVARASAPAEMSAALVERLDQAPPDDAVDEGRRLPPIDPSMIDSPMPGEGTSAPSGLMPGEQGDISLMPGETRHSAGRPGLMPGEAG